MIDDGTIAVGRIEMGITFPRIPNGDRTQEPHIPLDFVRGSIIMDDMGEQEPTCTSVKADPARYTSQSSERCTPQGAMGNQGKPVVPFPKHPGILHQPAEARIDPALIE